MKIIVPSMSEINAELEAAGQPMSKPVSDYSWVVQLTAGPTDIAHHITPAVV